MNFKHASFFAMMVLGIFIMSCEKDSGLTPEPNEKQGKLELEITDAPVDDPNIKSVFVTVADLQINDQSFPDFSPVTLDLLTLQNGTTAMLGTDSIKTGTYNEIALILDPDECYIEDINGNRHNLVPEVVKLELSHEFTVEEDSSVQLLVDFDLRKTITRNLTDTVDRYDFVSAADMTNGLRVINKSKVAKLTGHCMDSSTESEMIVGYLYNKGEYDASTETDVSDESQLRFKNAVTSAMVQQDGMYVFPFLENGEYELHFASYLENDTTGQIEFRGLLEVNSSDVEEVLNISVESSTETVVDLSVTGLLPL